MEPIPIDQEDREHQERQFKFNKDAILFRRSEVLRLLSRGYSQADIVREFGNKVDKSTISIDVQYIHEQAKTNIQQFITEQTPEEVQKAFSSYDDIIKEAWTIADSSIADKRTKLQALMLIKDTFAARLDLISNVDIVSRVLEIARKKRLESQEEVVAVEGKEDNEQPAPAPIEQDEEIEKE